MTGGFNNWKLALTKERGFPKHESSIVHIHASSNYQEYISRANSRTSIINVLDRGRTVQIQKNRQRLMKIASGLLFCSRQMISLRGHDENER